MNGVMRAMKKDRASHSVLSFLRCSALVKNGLENDEVIKSSLHDMKQAVGKPSFDEKYKCLCNQPLTT